MPRAALGVIAAAASLACTANPPAEPPQTPEPAPAPRTLGPPRTAAGERADAVRPSAAETSWFMLRITEARWCTSPRMPSQRALGVAVELENRTDAWLQVRDRDIELIGDSGRKIVRSLPPIGSECPSDKLGVMKPRSTRRGWFYFAPSAHSARELSLSARLREPHGFAVANLRLSLPAAGHQLEPASEPPAAAPRPPPTPGVAPPVERPFYRVTVTQARPCGGAPLPDGHRLFGVEVLLENFASVDLEPSYTAVLRDESGSEYDSVIAPQPECEPRASAGARVRPEDAYRSWLWAFAVPDEPRRYELVYRVRGSALDAWEEVRIPIGEQPSTTEPHAD